MIFEKKYDENGKLYLQFTPTDNCDEVAFKEVLTDLRPNINGVIPVVIAENVEHCGKIALRVRQSFDGSGENGEGFSNILTRIAALEQNQLSILPFVLPDNEDMRQWIPNGYKKNANGKYIAFSAKETDITTIINAGSIFNHISPNTAYVIFEFSANMNTAINAVNFSEVGSTNVTTIAGIWLDSTHIQVNFPTWFNNYNNNLKNFQFDLSLLRDVRSREILLGDQKQTFTLNASYLTLKNGGVIYFELDNTPLSIFTTLGTVNVSVTINGVTTQKNQYNKLYFGKSYENTTILPEFFIRETYLTDLDLSIFKNLIQMYPKLLYGTDTITIIRIGNVDWSNITVGNPPFSSASNVTTNEIHAASLELGNIFKTKMGAAMSNWTVVVD